ncbi:class I SAM-dependent methyltransferase [Marinoscillum pacificum]|uniref:class I SAM-dependent methyltransferase n=1 Tax=Marinoscillum pacificum TaxID=392723 RepID=UPI0021579695|nr:class I SAM-dependent methyltransferase [Marinoscillum pacificum]
MKVAELASNITLSENKYWVTEEKEKVSYTKNGHELIKESEENSFWFNHRLTCLNELIKLYPIKHMMDIGGGNGQISEFLQSKHIQTILLEPRLSGVKNAQKRGIEQIIWGSLQNIDFKPNSIESVGLFDVLEHIENDKDIIASIHDILLQNGTLWITVPAWQFLYSEFDKEVGHFRRYNLTELTTILKEAGFNVQYKSYLFFLLPFVIWPVRKFYKLQKKETKRRKFGHIDKSSFIGIILKFILRIESYMISKKMHIPFGSTCLVVAKKESK